jgi:hypothetical protein
VVLAALEAGEGFTEAIGRRVEARVVVEFDRTTVVLLISGLSTDLYKQIFRKMRFVVRGLLDGIFFFFS